MNESKFIIYAVSDATGELAMNVSIAALKQFKKEGVSVLRRSRVRHPERILKIVKEAAENNGIIVFTLVSSELRDLLLRLAIEAKVLAIDVMGPVMEAFSKYFDTTPSDQPGLQYEITGEYFRRNEAIEFAIKHDDGQGLETIDQADIVLLGISRTSKTPLSIYLAYRGFKTANVPIIHQMPVPRALYALNPKKRVGLIVSPEKLAELRGSRLAKLGLPVSTNYANLDFIRQEMNYAEKIFAEMGACPVIDVTSKAIEEVASEVLTLLGK